MDNEEIAEICAKIAFRPNSESKEREAVQLLLEDLMVPGRRDGYTKSQMKSWILDKLNRY